MSIAENLIVPPASAVDPALRDSRRRPAGAEDRLRARRRRTAVDGVVVAVSTAALITGGGWLAILGPMLLVLWHSCGHSRTYQQGLHRRDDGSPRHTGGGLPRLLRR